jgi:hypothetical protein
MLKILAPLGLYWYLILDIILTHVFVIAFLSAGFASVAGFLSALDSIFYIVLLAPLSKLSVRLSPWARGRACAFLRVCLIVIWLVNVKQLPLNQISLLIFISFLFFKFLLVVNSSFSTDFIFIIKEDFNIDVSQSAAAQNILLRSSTAIAPAVALTIFATPSTSLVIVILSIITAILSTIFLRNVFFSPKQNLKIPHHKKHIPLRILIANPLMRFGFTMQVFGNLAFAGVAFLFLSQLDPKGSIFWNEITILYTAFFVVQCAVLFFGDRVIPANKPVHVAVIMALCGFMILISSLNHGIVKLVICGFIGLTYSLLLSACQKIINYKLKGEGFIEYSSWAAIIGRLVSSFIIITIGIIVNAKIPSDILLTSCGIAGLLGAMGLTFLSRSIKAFDPLKM